jgi:CRISPR-associated endonuclease Cas1
MSTMQASTPAQSPPSAVRTGPWEAVFTREPSDPRVIVADGAGVSITVDRGHLVVKDGLGKHRRVRRYPRVERTLRRIVIMSNHGYVSLDAYTWCAELGVTIVQLDRAGRVVSGTSAGHTDARLIRAQALSGDGGPYYATGLAIVKNLLAAKLSGHAKIAEEILGSDQTAQQIRDYAAKVEVCTSVNDARGWEAAAASVYWDAWAGMPLPWRPADRKNIPQHWATFSSRASNATPGASRSATNPVNAILNYAYRLAEVECTAAILAVGLDPTLGYLHLDQSARDSLALDVIEVVRPAVERFVLELLSTTSPVKYLNRQWFHELPDGQCRLVAPLTHIIAESMPVWARTVASFVDQIARMVAAVGKGDVKPATRVVGSAITKERKRGREPRPPRITGIATVERIIPDELWSKVSAMLPPKPAQPNGGAKWADDRAVIAGIVCKEILGSSWAQIPATLGTNRWTCSARLDLLKTAGVWEPIRGLIAASNHLDALSE